MRDQAENLIVELETAASLQGPWTVAARRSGDYPGWQTGSYYHESVTPPWLIQTMHQISGAPGAQRYYRLKAPPALSCKSGSATVWGAVTFPFSFPYLSPGSRHV